MSGIENGVSFAPSPVRAAITEAMPQAPPIMDTSPMPEYSQIDMTPIHEYVQVQHIIKEVPNTLDFIPSFPMGQERRELIAGKTALLPIAEHETGHALIARIKGEGGNIRSVSVVPNSERLGEVSFFGNVYNFEAIAAGGSAVKGIYGEASGYGSDLMKIARSGGSVDRGQMEAKSILKDIPRDVIINISEMLVLKGNATGSEFDQIVRQAYLEAGLKEEYKPFKQVESDLITRIIWVDEFTTIIRKEQNNEILSEKQYFRCPVCGGTEGHLSVCAYANRKEANQIVNKNSEYNSGIITNGDSVTIFSPSNPINSDTQIGSGNYTGPTISGYQSENSIGNETDVNLEMNDSEPILVTNWPVRNPDSSKR